MFFKRVLNILCKLVKIWYLVNVSANRISNNINFEVCHSFITIRVCLIKPNSGDAQYVHLEHE